MNLSIVIPLLNEAESLPELTAWISRVCIAQGYEWELIYVDDGSSDDSWEVITQLRQADHRIKGIKFQRNYGKSAALNEAFEAAQGDVVITMDADLQDSPDEIPELYRLIMVENWDIVSGWKKKRYDPLSKTIPTKLFNWATRKVSWVNNLHDFNCGLKVYRAEVVKSIEVYGEMHRYIPVIANWAGFKKIEEQVVEHRSRKYGHTKFGLERFVNGFLDLLSIYFVSRFGKKPMHFFGLLGSLSFFSGGVITLVVIFDKLYKIANNLQHRDITSQPLFFLALVLVIVGVQLFVTGFLAELVSRSSADRNRYLIKQRTGLE
jgi:glycosyltransferase involved in cell wall biosynthesis